MPATLELPKPKVQSGSTRFELPIVGFGKTDEEIASKSEDTEILKSFLGRTFLDPNKDKDNPLWNSLELYLNATCDLECSYCYLIRNADEYFHAEGSQNRKQIVGNLRKLIDWIQENDYWFRKVYIFSGEPLRQVMGHEVIEMCIESNKEKRWFEELMIPTNMSFLTEPKLRSKVESYFERLKAQNAFFHLSASVDGIEMEENRAYRKKGVERDDVWYDDLFTFGKKYRVGYHPMIYFNNVEKWKDNFLWWQKKLQQHEIEWTNLYLLEVRNKEWTYEQSVELAKFCYFLTHWTFSALGQDLGRFLDFVAEKRGFNILSNWIGELGRGMGCSIQDTLFVRVGDLRFVPCHRTAYSAFDAGELSVDPLTGKIKDIVGLNVDLYMAIMSVDSKNFPYCERCAIRRLCLKGCLGSQFEATGDMFCPPPSMCRMQFIKLIGLVKAFDEIGALSQIFSLISNGRAREIQGLLDTKKEFEELWNSIR